MNNNESFIVNGEKFFSAEQFKEVMIRRSPEYAERHKNIIAEIAVLSETNRLIKLAA